MKDELPAVSELARAFGEMTDAARQAFLHVYGHELTIVARMAFIDGDAERARACNESLHRILGFLAGPPHEREAQYPSFITMIVSDAAHKGCSEILMRALARSGSA